MKRIIPIVLVLAMLFASCGEAETVESDTPTPSPSPSATHTPTPTPTPSPSPTPEPTPDGSINPLSGLRLEGEVDASARPAAVMINNIKQALPQYGTSAADIVYEVVAEGGITRLVAVYQDASAAGTIGSIRSTRPYYLDIACGHDAILFHAGGSEDAYRLIRERDIDNVDGTRGGGSPGSTYYQDAARKKQNGYEHSTMTTGERIADYLDRTAYRTEHEDGYELGLVFEEGYTPSGEEALTARVYFSKYKQAGLEYDADSGRYLVEQYGKAHVDAGTGEQLGFENVIVLYTDISMIAGDSAGRMEVDLVGGGDGVLLCGGKRVPIEWKKDAFDKPFRYLDASGGTQTLRSGKTYVCVVSGADRLTVGE